MKKVVILGVSLFLVVGLFSPSFAQQAKGTLNISEAVKAAQSLKRYKVLLGDKEMMARYQRISAALKAKQDKEQGVIVEKVEEVKVEKKKQKKEKQSRSYR